MAGAEMRRAYSLDEVRTFLLEECNLRSIFYSSEIKQLPRKSWIPFAFDCVLERRHRELVDASLIFEVATVGVLVKVVEALVNCSTWTHAKFQFGRGWFGTRDESSKLVFERRMFEVFHLHRSSPSLLHLDVSCTVNFAALAEALAGGVLRNSALKSLTLHTSNNSCYDVDVKSLEVLFSSASMTSVKELVLRFADCETCNNCVVNLVRWNSNLGKLTLCSTNFWSRLKDVTYTWTSENHGRALQVKYSETDFFFSVGLIKPLTAKFSLDHNPDGIFIRGTDISTLHLSLSIDHLVIASNCNLSPREWVQAVTDNMLSLVTSVASMSGRNTTLKHVQLSFEWGRQVTDLICSCRKQVELSTQKKLREMVGNELRGNTSLETLEVGYWKLIRRGQHVGGGTDEWHTSYGGPCLKESTLSNEYVVKVQM